MPRSGLHCFVCFLLSLAAIWLLSLTSLVAQNSERVGPSSEGKEFRIAFEKNYRDSVEDGETKEIIPAEPVTLGVRIVSRYSGRGIVQGPDDAVIGKFRVEPGRVVAVDIDPSFQVSSSETVERLSVHVTADVPITVYGYNHRYQTTDTYLAFPVDALGRSYRALGYKWLASDLLSQFAVVGTEDNTIVEITPTANTQKGRKGAQPFSIRLDAGEVYQVIPAFNPAKSCDLTGSLITSDKPVAVFSGHNCAYVPEREWKACNMLVEQVLPTDTWGEEFVVGPFSNRRSAVMRVVAHVDGTVVQENGSDVARLAGGEFYENDDIVEPTLVTTSAPAMVALYSKGFTAPEKGDRSADSIGDPMMILVPPTNQYLSSYSVATPFAGAWEHYVNLTVKAKDAKGLRMDGKPVSVGMLNPVKGTDYIFAQIPVAEGTHLFEGPGSFGLYSYGFGYADKRFDAYGNNCGQGVSPTLDRAGLREPDGERR